MHADQVDVSVGTVADLVADQFPQWRAYPVRPVASDGTVNALFRVGEEIVLRFPLRPDPDGRQELRDEQDHARRLAGCVPVAVPEPLGLGEPGDGYPGAWAAYRWIPGDDAERGRIADPGRFARDLAGFVSAVHGIDSGGRSWAGRGRGGPLHTYDAYVRDSLAASGRIVDTVGLGRIWARCRDVDGPAGDGWIHADLMPGNLLVRAGRLAAVIDLGAVGVGDPAVDLMPAWNLLVGSARETYRRALDADDATWERGRGWAIVQAIGALPYYVDSNPAMARIARRTLDAVVG